jgi:hypothetical protein
MAKAGRRVRADFATADEDLRSASVAPLLGHPDRRIGRPQWMDGYAAFHQPYCGARRPFGLGQTSTACAKPAVPV